MSLLPYLITTDQDVAGIVDLVANRLGASSSKAMYRRAFDPGPERRAG